MANTSSYRCTDLPGLFVPCELKKSFWAEASVSQSTAVKKKMFSVNCNHSQWHH